MQAERLVKFWDGLEAEHRHLKDSEQDEACGKAETRMKAFVADQKRDSQLEPFCGTGSRLGIKSGSRLDQVMRKRNIKRAMTKSIRRTRGLGGKLGI